MNQLFNYTVYQLFDEYDRFILKDAWDSHVSIILAGGKPDSQEQPENWKKDIHV
nr:MAG TPA: hypothetical protein [Caudoviricetes sp.]